MTPPAVSILMPFLNTASTLSRAIDSIAAQSYPDWELIALDDGSTDRGPEIAQAAARQDKRIRLVRTPRGGIVKALQAAAGEARGALLARMDADDEAHPGRLAKQAAFMQANPEVALCGTQVQMEGPALGPGRLRYQSWINAVCSHDDIAREIFVECPLPHPTFVMRRDAYDKIGGYQDRPWPEDYDLVLRFWAAGMKLGKVARPLLLWNDSPQRLSMRDARYSDAAFRAVKRHYLFRTRLKSNGAFYQWGAGEVGKRWLREWGRTAPRAVVDINPRKIGQHIHGVPVIAPEDLPPPPNALVLVAVGAPGAREDIRAWMRKNGRQEPQDYLFLA